MDFQVFYQGGVGEGSDYKISGNGSAKPCNVMFSHTKKVNEEANKCSGTILVEFTRSMH